MLLPAPRSCLLFSPRPSPPPRARRQHFHTDAINGALGHELKYGDSPLLSSYIRVGFRSPYDKNIPLKDTADGHLAWKTFTLRQDFFPCDKLQTEDDITASVVVPNKLLKGLHFRHQVLLGALVLLALVVGRSGGLPA